MSANRKVQRRMFCLLSVFFLTSCAQPGNVSQGEYAKSIKAADETAAIQLLRTIATAQAQSQTTRGAFGDFNSLVQAGLLDQRLASTSPEVNGYRFTMRSSETEFSLNADPQSPSEPAVTRNRYFYLDSTDNVIHVNPSGRAAKTDPVL